ncbi:MAG: CBO0543 family protein [Desulfosporosinus sp.]|jgi:hypothetical protein
MFNSNVDKMGPIDHLFQKIFEIVYQYWLNDVLLTWRWWLLVILTIVPWIIWLLLRKKDSTYRLLLAGLSAALIASYLDKFGYWLSLWSYPIITMPIMPPHSPWNLTLAPVLIMLTIQFKPQISPYLKAVVFSLVCAFVFQPLSDLLGFYNPKVWHHYYSVPFFIVIYLIAHFLATRKEFRPLK